METRLIFESVIFDEVGWLVDDSELARRGEPHSKASGHFILFSFFILILVVFLAVVVAFVPDGGILNLVFDNFSPLKSWSSYTRKSR
jgi:hypothetical protein